MATKTMSGAEFKALVLSQFTDLKDNDEVIFGSGDISFHRVKDRGPREGPKMLFIEFNEVYAVTVDPGDAAN